MSDHVGNNEELSIVHLGSSLDKKQISLWRDIETNIFEDDIYYMPSTSIPGQNEDIEFYVLYDGDKAIGRAAPSVNQQWIDEKGDNLGFISDFVISPQYRHAAGMLIEHCLSVLREKGVEGAIIRSRGFPALAAQELGGDVSPFSLPCNPPWYVDLFEERGFVKHKEWANYRLSLPSKVYEDNIDRVKKHVKGLDVKMGPLNMRNRRHINEYNALKQHILEGHFGLTRQTFMTDIISLRRHILFIMLCRLTKFRIHVLEDASGRIVGLLSFCPNYNIAARSLIKSSGPVNSLLALPRFIISLRRIKRAEIEAIGLADEMRGRGFVRLMDYGLKAMVKGGYKEVDTGPISTENTVVIKMVKHIQGKYDLNIQHMRYYTLMHRF